MKARLRLFTDPHLGLNKVSHTTPASRSALRKAVFNAAYAAATTDRQVICLGDLFDSFSVDNEALLEGYKILDLVELTLFGNHDLANRTDKKSAIQLIDLFIPRLTFSHESADSPKASMIMDEFSLPIWYIDHKLTQEIFEAALDDALARATKGSVLLLHCNYNSAFATQESTLNLTRDKAKLLLDKFTHIFIGHEHNKRTDLDGRVVLLGNTHPTSFSDISDKFYWDIDINENQITKIEPVMCWSAAQGYLYVDWTDLHEITELDKDIQFVEVGGVIPAEHMPLISRRVAELWNLSDNLLMVRNNVVAESAFEIGEGSDQMQTRCKSIPDQITADLAGTKLESVWNSYRAQLG
jgi:DNA repair exonuclease SbcCD nuclease subunit